MNIDNAAFRAMRVLQDDNLDDKRAREMALNYLDSAHEYSRVQLQDNTLLMEFAKTSGRSKFKLIGRVNTSGLELMEWCDDAQNFDGMCSSFNDIKSAKDGVYVKRTYSLEELPSAIDNALNWYNSVKRDHHSFNNTMLHILAVD